MVDTFSTRLEVLRREKGLSKAELSDSLYKVSRQSISNYINGRSNPELSVLVQLADFFDCTLDYLLGRSDFKNEKEMVRQDDEVTLLLEMCRNYMESDERGYFLETLAVHSTAYQKLHQNPCKTDYLDLSMMTLQEITAIADLVSQIEKETAIDVPIEYKIEGTIERVTVHSQSSEYLIIKKRELEKHLKTLHNAATELGNIGEEALSCRFFTGMGELRRRTDTELKAQLDEMEEKMRYVEDQRKGRT